MNVKGASGEVPGGGEEHAVGKGRKDDSVLKRQRTWLSSVLLDKE